MAGKSQIKKWQPNALFRSGGIMHLNACVGENGGPYDLADYAHGFFLGGDAIVDATASRDTLVDLAIYPIAFSYRHGIELYVKHLIRSCNRYLSSNLAHLIHQRDISRGISDAVTSFGGDVSSRRRFDMLQRV